MGTIIEELETELAYHIKIAKEIYIATAMCEKQAVELLDGRPQSCIVKIVTGINLPTPPDVLTKLKKRFSNNAKIYKEHFFHPKVYLLILQNNTPIAYIGSANFTCGGLCRNIELSYKITDSNNCQEILDWFNNKIYNNAFCITDEFINDYQKQYKIWKKHSKEATEKLEKLYSRHFITIKTEELKEELSKIKLSNDYEQICKERTQAIKELKSTLDYQNAFIRIDIDAFFNIPELGRIRQAYKRQIKYNINDFRHLCQFLSRNDRMTTETKFKQAINDYHVEGCGKNIITKILVIHNPDKYLLWNSIVDEFIKKYGIQFKKGLKDWEKYGILCLYFKTICKELDIKNFAVLDALLCIAMDKSVD